MKRKYIYLLLFFNFFINIIYLFIIFGLWGDQGVRVLIWVVERGRLWFGVEEGVYEVGGLGEFVVVVVVGVLVGVLC